MRRDNMDGNDDRIRDLPPRGGHQGGLGNSSYGGRQGRPSNQRRDRRDDRRRTTDDQDTVLDSQDVAIIDRGKYNIQTYILDEILNNSCFSDCPYFKSDEK